MSESVGKEEIKRLESNINRLSDSVDERFRHTASQDSVRTIFDRLETQKDKISYIDSEVKVLEALIEPLKELPTALNCLRESLVGFQGAMKDVENKVDVVDKKLDKSLEQVHKRVDKISNGLDEQEERGKIDVVKSVTQSIEKNWFQIVTALAMLYCVIKNYI